MYHRWPNGKMDFRSVGINPASSYCPSRTASSKKPGFFSQPRLGCWNCTIGRIWQLWNCTLWTISYEQIQINIKMKESNKILWFAQFSTGTGTVVYLKLIWNRIILFQISPKSQNTSNVEPVCRSASQDLLSLKNYFAILLGALCESHSVIHKRIKYICLLSVA